MKMEYWAMFAFGAMAGVGGTVVGFTALAFFL